MPTSSYVAQNGRQHHRMFEFMTESSAAMAWDDELDGVDQIDVAALPAAKGKKRVEEE